MMSSTLISNFPAIAAATALTCTGPSADNHAFQARESAIKRAAEDGFDAALVTANSDALAYFFSHLKPKAPIAFPNGVEPEPRFNGHSVSAFDGAMSHEAFKKLNAAIGTRTLPLKTHVFSFKDVAAAHHRIEEGHVVGKIVLHVDL